MGVEKRLPGCRVWECELLLTAKKLYEASRSVPPLKSSSGHPRKQVEPLLLASGCEGGVMG